jgi:hypothetical protein
MITPSGLIPKLRPEIRPGNLGGEVVPDGAHRADGAQDGKNQERHHTRDEEVERQVCQEGHQAARFHLRFSPYLPDGGETSRCTLVVEFQPPPQALQL